MAGRIRTTKKLAQRIDLDYFKRRSSISRWRLALSFLFAVVALSWLGWHALAGSPKPYNAGRLAHSHVLLAAKCNACHVASASYRRSATDSACLSCHDGPIHHAEQTFQPACADCHVEHRGAARLANTSDRACTQCHADLKTQRGPLRFAANIRTFENGHPEFAALRPGFADPGTVKFSHRVHLKADLRAPQGNVQLQCADCHQASGRLRMAAINYEKHCSSCHPLQFDRRIGESAPHKDPKIVYEFVRAKLTAYIAAHPSEVSLVDPPDKRLPARPLPPAARNAAEWVDQRMADAQLLLWRKACSECHSLSYPNGADAIPHVAKSALTERWLPHGRFGHQSHQMVQCGSCHVKASESGAASDVLIPGIQVCRECHRSGENAAEARCFECHSYHDWTKIKPVAGKYSVAQIAE